MTGVETVQQDVVEWVLAAGEALCGVVVLVVYVQIVVAHSLLCLLAQKNIVYEWLCCLAGEFHHHTCRGVGVHVGILAGYII